ncbi:hypothetical protein Hdeb2414_s0001g00037001 [Helianthus debilis subsp. tardiflorus]
MHFEITITSYASRYPTTLNTLASRHHPFTLSVSITIHRSSLEVEVHDGTVWPCFAHRARSRKHLHCNSPQIEAHRRRKRHRRFATDSHITKFIRTCFHSVKMI